MHANTLDVQAVSNSPINANAYGGQLALACVGASIATAAESGITRAYISDATVDPLNLTVSATATSVVSAVAKSGRLGDRRGNV